MLAHPMKAAVVGIGGFAGAHHTALRELEQAGRVKVVAACDPAAANLEVQRTRYGFEERGVAVYQDFDSLLAAHGDSLDLVSVASPIRYHAEHHRACVERGIACYLEKPPTLDPEELEAMLAVEANARFATQVGFNYISQTWRQQLKERLLEGEFGRLRRVAFQGCWRRSLAYYGRNSWAGRLMLDNYLLLDSCCGNAMAHYVHNLLFHAGGDGVMSWAGPESLEAELYRANDIEGADTVFARGVLDNGVEFLLASTHACKTFFGHVEVLECEQATIEISGAGPGEIVFRSGGREIFDTGTNASGPMVRSNLDDYCRYLAGLNPRAATTLCDSRPFVRLNALLYLAAGKIHTIGTPPAARFRAENEEHNSVHVPGIEAVCGDFVRTGRLPSEAGVEWADAGGKAHLQDLSRLRSVLETLREPAAGFVPKGVVPVP